jgi:hypothetical protein
MALDRIGGELHIPIALSLGNNPGTHWTRANSLSGEFWRRENLLLLLEFEPQAVQPIPSHYTDYDIQNSENVKKQINNHSITLRQVNTGMMF